LPDGTNEVYGYDKISEKDSSGQYVLSKENKRHNADSFAFVATGEQNLKATSGQESALTSPSCSMV